MISRLVTIISVFAMMGANAQEKNEIKPIAKENFSKVIDGNEIALYTLRNDQGWVAEITNYGGKVVSLWLPDREGKYEDVVLGHSDIEEYLTSKEKYFGALIGRYGNRIGEGRFTLDEKEYTLATNNGKNHLHGGDTGYDAVIWDAVQLDDKTLQLSYLSKDGEEGYPGNLEVKVNYQLTDLGELKVEYWATTDKPTVINLTHHSFFNLKGAGKGTINDHLLQINASYFTPVDDGLIPTGQIGSVVGTPMDFRKLTKIGERVDSDYKQLNYGLGYDHNYVLNQNLEGLNFAAKAVEPLSGRIMEVFTNEPGLQFYGGNFLDGSIVGKERKIYGHRTAFCLETQHFPDSPNKPWFPSTRLDPGDEYHSVCVYKFSIAEKSSKNE